MTKTDFIVLNKQSGEIIYELAPGDKIVTEQQSSYVMTHEKDFNKKTDFIKSYTANTMKLFYELSAPEFTTIHVIAAYADYGDNILKNSAGQYMKISEIAERMGKDYDNTRKIISSLETKEVLCKVKVNDGGAVKRAIVINPYIFFRGKDIAKSTLILFNNSRWSKKPGK